MTHYPMNSNPKKLSIREMYKLYKLVGDSHKEKYLVDEVIAIMQGMSQGRFVEILRTMYDSVSIENPSKLSILFINGLKFCKFFDFQQFIKAVHVTR